MPIHLIEKKATQTQMHEMLQSLESYVKLAVDIKKGIVAGGGTLHADCEAVLLVNGSDQINIWGADWFPFTQQVTFESLINIRPSQENFSMEVQDTELRSEIEVIALRLLGGILL